jgi:FkbM family methyltransferase
MNTYIDSAFSSNIKIDDIKVIFECGARQCEDSIEIHNTYKGIVYAFEADPLHVTKNYERKDELKNNGVIVFPKPLALYSHSGFIDFGSIDLENSFDKTDADSVGSILKLNYNRQWNDTPLRIQQKFIKVECITIDLISNILNVIPDMLCLDAQGSELEIIKGANEVLHNIKYIITEINYNQFYENMPLFEDIDKFLTERNFELVHKTGTYAFADALYRNKK